MKRLIFIVICLLAFSCKKETPLTIGQNYEGGVIFYINSSGMHGLVAAPSDQSTAIQWYNGHYVKTNTFGGAVGVGLSNTATIVTVQGTGTYAASLCDQLTLNGYSDWFLPARNELDLLFQQKDLVGGFTNDYYWTSQEYDTLRAWNQYFPHGSVFYKDKASKACVRAIRQF